MGIPKQQWVLIWIEYIIYSQPLQLTKNYSLQLTMLERNPIQIHYSQWEKQAEETEEEEIFGIFDLNA